MTTWKVVTTLPILALWFGVWCASLRFFFGSKWTAKNAYIFPRLERKRIRTAHPSSEPYVCGPKLKGSSFELELVRNMRKKRIVGCKISACNIRKILGWKVGLSVSEAGEIELLWQLFRRNTEIVWQGTVVPVFEEKNRAEDRRAPPPPLPPPRNRPPAACLENILFSRKNNKGERPS